MNKTLRLLHGEVALPAFFPDATQGFVRCADQDDLLASQVPGLVVNTYHLLARPGMSVLRASGGLHAFGGWPGPMLSDSGGFQVFSLIRENAKYGQVRDNEIIFRPENQRGRMTLTPEKCIQAQFAIGSDVMMCLDWCTHPNDPADLNERSVERTVAWGARCRAEFDRQVAARRLPPERRPLLFGIIQGGNDAALRTRCAEGLRAIGFDGYGYGGWPMDDTGALVADTLALTARLMPDDTPKYAMGVGRPEEIVVCHAMGYDLFDCVIPTREARHNRLYVWRPGVDIHQSDFYRFHYSVDDVHTRDTRPVDETCDCLLCRKYSRAWLRHLIKSGDSQALRLASMHNLRFYTRLMQRLRGEP